MEEEAALPRVELRLVKESLFEGESLRVEVEVANTSDGLFKLPDIQPGFGAILFTLEDLWGGSRREADDITLRGRARRSVPQHIDVEYTELPAGQSWVASYDLLGYFGPLTRGGYRLAGRYRKIELNLPPVEFEVSGPRAPSGAHCEWEFERGAGSDGYCIWTSEDSAFPGVYLRAQAREAPDCSLANTHLYLGRPPERSFVSRASRYQAPVRHAGWVDEQTLHVVTLQDGHAVGEPWQVPGAGTERMLTDPRGRLWVVRLAVFDNHWDLVAEGWSAPGVPLQAGPPLASGGLPPPKVDAVIDTQARLWVVTAKPGELRLACFSVDGDTAEQQSSAAGILPLGGPEVAWLSVNPQVVEVDGEWVPAPSVCCILRSTERGTHLTIDPAGQLTTVAEGSLPVGRVSDALVDKQGALHLLLEREGVLTYFLWGETADRPLSDDARFDPAWTQLIPLSRRGRYGITLRGVDGEGAFVHLPPPAHRP